jgi:hypothetical protein
MKQLLQVVVMVFALALPVYAADVQSSIDLSALNDQQRADIIKQVADTKAKAASPIESVTPTKVAEWIGVGKEVAELIPVFAEKTGIAADKVLDSFSGKVLLTIVLVHFFWTKMMGIAILSIGIPLWYRWFRSMFLIKEHTVEYNQNPFMRWIGFNKRTVQSYSFSEGMRNIGSAAADIWLWVSIILLALILLFGLAAIF